ncbi:MAG TPA: DUF892 family protein [Chitinophaga sp.]
MKRTSSKNTASRTAKSTGGRAAGRAKRATATSPRTSTSSRKAAVSPKSATAGKAAKPAAQKTADRKANSKLAALKAAPRKSAAKTATRSNTRATARIKQSSAKDLLMEFFQDEIKDIYWAEKNIVKTLPKMKKAATSRELKAAFDQHMVQSQEHVSRLETVFQQLGKKAQAKKCDAMDGIIKEGEEIISSTDAGTATRDVGLILAAQKVEHYEIATYGGLAQLARTLQLNDVADLLETTLQEEKDTDAGLTNIAENHVNYDALRESEGPQAATMAASNGGDEDDDDDEADDEGLEFDEADIDVDEDEEEEDDDFDDEDDLEEAEDEDEES